MDIQIRGHHVEVTDALREAVLNKLGHLNKYDHEISNIEVTLTIEKERQIAAATVNLPHQSPLHAEVTSKNMYSAIDELEEILKHSISDHKKKLDAKKHACSIKRD